MAYQWKPLMGYSWGYNGTMMGYYLPNLVSWLGIELVGHTFKINHQMTQNFPAFGTLW